MAIHALRRGFCLLELLIAMLALAILVALIVPSISRGRSLSGLDASLSNLAALGFAHAIYAADYNGRQVTLVVDDLASYGDDPVEALSHYNDKHEPNHPNIYAGWGPLTSGGGIAHWAYFLDGSSVAHSWATMPIYLYGSPFSPVHGFGNFRFRNSEAFNAYVEGRWYGETFYAPNDTVTYDCVEAAFDSPHGFVPYTHLPCADPQGWSSYCFSPAALFHPDILALNPSTGQYFTDPWSIDHGMNTPGLYQARYPALKTHLVEHYWNQNPLPDPCNPAFLGGTYQDCEPYFFNHALASEPATLFYDLSIRLLPNAEALAADKKLMSSSGHGTWSRDTSMGESGYFGDYSYDGLVLSHHIFTIDGILGRDTLSGLSPGPQPPQRHRAAAAPGWLNSQRHAPGSTSDAMLLPELE